MSNRSSLESGYVFADFLACEVCFRDYDSSNPSVPFWITACGHVLCDAHRPRVRDGVVDPSAQCMKCGTTNMSIEQFGPAMGPDVAAYFNSTSSSLEKVVGTSKYQEQYLFNLISFFKEKTLKQKSTLDGIQGQLQRYDETVQRVAELEQEVAELRSQLSGRGKMGPPSHPASADGDGRRRPMEADVHNSDPGQHTRRVRSSSGSLTNVLPPHRLSLKPSQRAPSVAAVANEHSRGRRGGSESRENEQPVPMDVVRPSSALDRFAYNPASHTPARRISSTPRPNGRVERTRSFGEPDPPHEVIQLTPARNHNHHRFSFPPPATPSASRAPSRLSGRGGGGAGPSSNPIRAMPPPAAHTPHRPNSVVYNSRNPPPSQLASQPTYPSPRLAHASQSHFAAPPGTPRPGTTSNRVPFVPLIPAAPEHEQGGARPMSRVAAHQQPAQMDEQWGYEQGGEGYVGGGEDGYGYGGG